MINVEVARFGFGLKSTISRVYADGGPWDRRTFLGFVLEDQVRPPDAEKVYGETAIPKGTYSIDLRTEGGMHTDYADRWPEWHKGMLWYQDVPDFEYIYMHPANTDLQLKGCQAPGVVPVMMPDGEFQVRRSVDAYKPLYIPLSSAIIQGEKVAVHIYNMKEVL